MTSSSLNALAILNDLVRRGEKLTPMMRQYLEIKQEYPDHILLYRMGDFYETFFEDAILASKILNIALTKRGKAGDIDIPMAGIPHHAAAAYVDKLIDAGLKAAICDQVEDAAEAKGIVKRAVTRVATPSMPFDLDRAEGSERHYMAAGFKDGSDFYLVIIDFTTGEFCGMKLAAGEEFLETLRLYSPKELITYRDQWSELTSVDKLCNELGILQTHLAEEYFSLANTCLHLSRLIPTYKHDKVINQSPAILFPMGALAYYMDATQKVDDLFHIRLFRMLSEEGKMKVTMNTLVGLEILPRHRSSYKDSMLGMLDRCKTSLGSRYLHRMLLTPAREIKTINSRLDLVDFLCTNDIALEELRSGLSGVCDLERVMTKLATGKVIAGDLLNISLAARTYNQLKHYVEKFDDVIAPLDQDDSTVLEKLTDRIEQTINSELGANLDKGNLINRGVDKNRDKLAKLANSSSCEIEKLENHYRQVSDIPKLRVKSNNSFGYFIEVSKMHIKKVPAEFQRRQTLVGVERYTTEKLSELEREIISAKERLKRVETEILSSLVVDIGKNSRVVQELALRIAQIDVYASLAHVALQEEFSRPTLVEEKKIDLSGVWHPLIKREIKEQFVSHDLYLDKDNYFALITGPNMAGKTTVMREVAIVQTLAQIGSFVPVTKAILGTCDYLFSRLGASDDILRGQSTFMVEMSQTAEIIRHATENSLIILDEIGRGTSTYDGLSIAWSLTEHFAQKIKAITLFATHYHELIEVAQGIEGAKNLTVETVSEGGDVKFLYHLKEGGAGQSFGIYVAKLAGLPESILKRSHTILSSLEGGNEKIEKSSYQNQLNLLEKEQDIFYLKNLEESLKQLEPLQMTPLEAINKLDQLKRSLSSHSNEINCQ